MDTNNDFDKKTDRLLALFHIIRKEGEKKFIEALSKISTDNIDISTKDAAGNTLIFEAVTRGYNGAVKAILKYNPRLDILDTEGYSLLYYPIKQNDTDMVNILLGADKDSIGASLYDITDKVKNVPLFYAIKFNNPSVFRILVEKGANVNYQNPSRITALHMATIRGSMDMVKMLVQDRVDINARANDGSTALHYAVNFGRYEITKLLLENGADPTLIEFSYEFTPLIYAVEQNNEQIVRLLIEYDADPNQQDYIGNTAINYSLINGTHSISFMLVNGYSIGKKRLSNYDENINEPVRCQCIDPTIVNIDGLTLGHMMLIFYDPQLDTLISRVLPYCNLNYQDNKGDTMLTILARLDIWHKFKDILVKKKLNIFIKNNKNETPYSINNSKLFMDLVADSYQGYLKAYPDEWIEEWQNECSRSKDNCRDKVLAHIMASKTSVPTKKKKRVITIDSDKIVKFSTFTGSVLDIVSGFKYLSIKYPSCTSVFTSHANSETIYMKQLGIVENKHQAVMSIEIRWIYQKLFIPKAFAENIEYIINNSYEYIIIPIGIVLSNGSHSNCLIYHIKGDMIERFEPHGSRYPNKLNYNPDLLDSVLIRLWNNIISKIRKQDIKITYLAPQSYLPKVGFQTFENTEVSVNKNIGDPNGFCSLWCIFYLDYRLKYIDVSAKKLVKAMITFFNSHHLSFRTTIRNYSEKITNLRDQYLEKIGMDINDYLNDKLNSDDLDKLSQVILDS